MSTYTIDTATSRATPSPAPMKRLTVPALQARKGKEPIVALTAYTMRMAQLLDPHCDLLLVGDSLGQVIYGLPSTIPVSLDMMCAHGAAVVRGSWHALVAVDMPFGSYEESPEQAFRSAARVMKETGAAAVKLGAQWIAQERAEPEQILDSLQRKLRWSADADTTTFRRNLANAIADDFHNGEVVKVEGWQLAKTHAELCALAYFAAAGRV